MDYLEYGSYNESSTSSATNNNNHDDVSGNMAFEPAQPAPPLILPLNTVTNKFKNLSILSTLNLSTKGNAGDDQGNGNNIEEDLIDIAQQTAKKYSQMTLDLFEANELGIDSISTQEQPYQQSQNSNDKEQATTATKDLSLRLSKILNSYGYDTDATLRESLEFLQSSSSHTASNGSGMVLTDPYSFRNTVETELLKTHNSDLKLFSGVVSDLEEVRIVLKQLNSFQFLKAEETKDGRHNEGQLHQQISQLQTRKDSIQLKRSLLLQFKSKFMISEYDESLAYNATSQLNMETFVTFNRIYQTYLNAEVLMGISGSQIGLKVMERLSKTLSSYYQCFQAYLSKSIKGTGAGTGTGLNLKYIKLCNLYLSANGRREQYQSDSFLVDFQNSRISEISHDLKAQLNQLNASVAAVDSNRYLGDVLAYLHSLIVNEAEYVSGLLEISSSRMQEEFNEDERAVIEQFQTITGTNCDDSASNDELIVEILNSQTPLLEAKLSSILSSEIKPQVLIDCYQSLDFYLMIFAKLKIHNLSIFPMLRSLQQLTVKKVLTLIELQYQATVSQLNNNDWKLDEDLLLLQQDWLTAYLAETLVIFETSDTSPIFENAQFLQQVKDLIITKPIDLIKKQAKLQFPKTKPANVDRVREKNVFVLNNLDYLKYKTLSFPQLSKATTEATDTADSNEATDPFGISQLVADMAANELDTTLDQLSLKTANQLITLVYPPSQIQYDEDYEMYRSLLEHKIFSLDNLYDINDSLVIGLPDLNLSVNEKFRNLQSPVYVNEIVQSVLNGVVEVYKVFFKIVWMLYEEEDDQDHDQDQDEDHSSVIYRSIDHLSAGYKERKVLKWNVEEVKALIGV
ncbi:hypothetical protein WICPIJ_004510 [Wickerhamomyces pijperi]|uniref:Conserved oligomeric Golgi complex subunit 6 n=1 Tax=Wickerhamomyces pijperi TaxID=599730 RepID=A0A9P8Q5J2_WICPI|nr:hypothetical protein WICPIJ_004510 [Wickerhamomyces pijperi]